MGYRRYPVPHIGSPHGLMEGWNDGTIDRPITMFDATERALFAALADVLIPASEGFPCASQAGVAGEGLDQVLMVRPDLAAGLKQVLEKAKGRPPADAVADIQKNDPVAFGVIAELVPGAYFLNREVRAQLGYSGQSPRPIDPHPDYLEDGLLQSVIDRGAIYRPTPDRSADS